MNPKRPFTSSKSGNESEKDQRKFSLSLDLNGPQGIHYIGAKAKFFFDIRVNNSECFEAKCFKQLRKQFEDLMKHVRLSVYFFTLQSKPSQT